MPKSDKGYTVRDVAPRTILDRAGRMRDVYEVHFVTDSGVSDFVQIEKDDYSPEGVHAKIAPVAANHNAIVAE